MSGTGSRWCGDPPSSMKMGLPTYEMSDIDSEEDDRMRKRRRRSQILSIANVTHAVGTSSASFTGI